jgi:hypothetical protein
MGFKKIQILAQNTKVLVFGFTEKSKLVTKTDINSIFLSREAHIPDWLYIMITYINFCGF